MLVAAELIQPCDILMFGYCLLKAGAYNQLCSNRVVGLLTRACRDGSATGCA